MINFKAYSKKESINNLRNLVLPYIHYSMLHKLGVDNAYSSSFKPHNYI